jgi:hypothetical protein
MRITRVIPRRVQKYHAKPVTVDGIRFASTAEARRYSELKLLEKAGEIQRLQVQPRIPLHVSNATGKVRVGTYVGDFWYLENGEVIVEDVKSPPTKTALYRLKCKMLFAEYGITVRENDAR